MTSKEQSTGEWKWFVREGKRSIYYWAKVHAKEKVHALRAGCPRMMDQSARKIERSACGLKVSTRCARGQKYVYRLGIEVNHIGLHAS